MTDNDMERYLATLDPAVRHWHQKADWFVIEAADTPSEEFQLAACILNVFEERAKTWLEGRT